MCTRRAVGKAGSGTLGVVTARRRYRTPQSMSTIQNGTRSRVQDVAGPTSDAAESKMRMGVGVAGSAVSQYRSRRRRNRHGRASRVASQPRARRPRSKCRRCKPKHAPCGALSTRTGPASITANDIAHGTRGERWHSKTGSTLLFDTKNGVQWIQMEIS